MVRSMPRAFVFGLRDKFQATPRKANYIVQVLRLVLQFGVDRGWRSDNPASKPKLLKSPATATGLSRKPRSRAFRQRWPIGTHRARLL
jgi:hypothetical protein